MLSLMPTYLLFEISDALEATLDMSKLIFQKEDLPFSAPLLTVNPLSMSLFVLFGPARFIRRQAVPLPLCPLTKSINIRF